MKLTKQVLIGIGIVLYLGFVMACTFFVMALIFLG